MIGILVKNLTFQFKLFANNVTKFGAPGNRTPLNILHKLNQVWHTYSLIDKLDIIKI